jgi:uncharacterized protein (TIGR03086 family)
VTLDALDLATEEFGRRLAAVAGPAWDLPTPCPEWDVRYLAAHVVGGNRFAVAVLGGMAAPTAIELVMSTPQLGDDPMQAWATTCADQAAAFRDRGASERRVDHPVGELSGGGFLRLRIFDIALHAWDLARAIGVDDELAPTLVDTVLTIVEEDRLGASPGIDSPGASPQARLLALTGRHT